MVTRPIESKSEAGLEGDVGGVARHVSVEGGPERAEIGRGVRLIFEVVMQELCGRGGGERGDDAQRGNDGHASDPHRAVYTGAGVGLTEIEPLVGG
jgi:hypothetical protein